MNIFGDCFEILYELFQAWGRDSPLIVRVSIKLELLHVLKVDLVGVWFKIETP